MHNTFFWFFVGGWLLGGYITSDFPPHPDLGIFLTLYNGARLLNNARTGHAIHSIAPYGQFTFYLLNTYYLHIMWPVLPASNVLLFFSYSHTWSHNNPFNVNPLRYRLIG